MKKIYFFFFITLLFFCESAFLKNKKSDISEEELGKKLFFEKLLSKDKSVSCASCHNPEFAFADTSAFSIGIYGQKGTRNAPSVMNMLSRNSYFWDGRAQTLEEQVIGPIMNPIEMGADTSEIIERLNDNIQYKKLFYEVYGQYPNLKLLTSAISSYERTLETSHSEWDDYVMRDKVIDESILRGSEVFLDKGKCFQCHFSPDFTVDDFRNIGFYDEKKYNDKGRFIISKDSADMGKFKVPGLRNVALTAPYMHDGSLKTLREVIDYYNEPNRFIPNSINRDTLISDLHLSEQEKLDLENFLKALTDVQFLK